MDKPCDSFDAPRSFALKPNACHSMSASVFAQTLAHRISTLALAFAACLMVATTSVHATSPSVPQRLFVSGHSLTDPPLPRYLAEIAQSLGTPLQWNMQSVVGSAIHQRTRGKPGASGWTEGRHRDEGTRFDVRLEWQQPKTVQGGLYDTLLVAEQHGVLGALMWHDTVNTLREVHDAFIDANPHGRTWFYEAWLDVDDMANPARWIAYERAASTAWQCIAARVNLNLAQAGRPDRIASLPSGVALAWLVERATAGNVPGLSGAGVRETMKRIFADDVHLQPLGHYYLAAVIYGTMWGRSPVGATLPADLDPTAARAVLQEAADFVDTLRKTQSPSGKDAPSMARCRDHLTQGFIAEHWAYVRNTTWRRERGWLGAWWPWLKARVAWERRMLQGGSASPFAD